MRRIVSTLFVILSITAVFYCSGQNTESKDPSSEDPTDNPGDGGDDEQPNGQEPEGEPEEEVIPSVKGVEALGVRWVGRVDTTADKPCFSWSGSGFVARFTGTNITVKIKNDRDIYFQPVMDGKPLDRVEMRAGEDTYVGRVSEDKAEHIFEYYRETEGYSFGASQLLEIKVENGSLLEPPLFSGRTIEIVGDSISAGYGNLGEEIHPNWGDAIAPCRFSPFTESAYATYGWLAAKKLKADASILAASGFGMYQSNQGSTEHVLPKFYNRIIADNENPTWNFNEKVRPQVVVINLGTNDFYSGNKCPTVNAEYYKEAYSDFINTIRKNNSQAWIFCTIGPMLSDWYPSGCKVLTNVKTHIQSVIEKHQADGDDRISFLEFHPESDLSDCTPDYKSCTETTGCDWHPNVTVQQRMADILVQAIKQKVQEKKISW